MSSADSLYNISSVLFLQGFDLQPDRAIIAFIFATLNYIIILLCNFFLLFTIIRNKSLHQPMNILLLNLPINDLMGSTALLPHIMHELLFDTRMMSFSTCVTQAFFIHVYIVAAVFILTAMAYDRYIAICQPMRYTVIMSGSHLMRIISFAWLTNWVLMGILFILLLRLPRCRSYLTHTYCDNPSLMQLVCADTTVNNIYGLLVTAVCQVITVSLILYTYVQILIACFRNRSADTRSKALQTCGTHLVVFLLFECVGLYTIISYRLKDMPPQIRKFSGVVAMIIPPTLNPLIYGLKTKEIRVNVLKCFQRKVYT